MFVTSAASSGFCCKREGFEEKKSRLRGRWKMGEAWRGRKFGWRKMSLPALLQLAQTYWFVNGTKGRKTFGGIIQYIQLPHVGRIFDELFLYASSLSEKCSTLRQRRSLEYDFDAQLELRPNHHSSQLTNSYGGGGGLL